MVNLPLKAEAAHMWRKTSAYMLQVYEYTNLRSKIENVTCKSMRFPPWHSNSFWSITCLYLPRRPIPLALHQSVLLQTLEVFLRVFSAACRPKWWESVTSYPYVWESSVTLTVNFKTIFSASNFHVMEAFLGYVLDCKWVTTIRRVWPNPWDF